MVAPWPAADPARQDATIEARFAQFQEVLKGLREIRSRQNIPPKAPLSFAVRCDAETADLLRPMEPYFESMAGARATAWGAEVAAPETSAGFFAGKAEVFVDLAEHIDLDAERARHDKELKRVEGALAAKERQLANENFVKRAPAAVIEKERAALAQLQELHTATAAALAKLASARK